MFHLHYLCAKKNHYPSQAWNLPISDIYNNNNTEEKDVDYIKKAKLFCIKRQYGLIDFSPFVKNFYINYRCSVNYSCDDSLSQIEDINKSIASMYIAVVNDCTWHATDRTYLSFDCGILLRSIDDRSLCCKKNLCSLLLSIVLGRLSSWLPLKSNHSFFWLALYVDQNTCAQLQCTVPAALWYKSNCSFPTSYVHNKKSK